MKPALLIVLSAVYFCSQVTALHRVRLQRQITKESLTDHLASINRRYNRNSALPTTTANAGDRSQNLTLENYLNVQYYGQISLGRPAQCFVALFDTGSADTYVTGEDCYSNACNNHKKFLCSRSTTCMLSPARYTLQDAAGEVIGNLGADQFCFGCNGDAGALCVFQKFFSTTSESDSNHLNVKFDSVVGLSYDTLATGGAVTPITSLLQQGQCEHPVFAFWISQNPGDVHSNGGEMTICGTDPQHYTGEITYAPVTRQAYWQFKVDSLERLGQPYATDFQAIADTGSSFIMGPMDAVQAIYRDLGVKYNKTLGYGQLDCFFVHTLPTLTFHIAGKPFPVTPGNYVIFLENSRCFVGIAAKQGGDDSWVLGYTFLNAYYSVFDRANNQVGFAKAAPAPK